DDEADQADALLDKLLQLLRNVAPGEDARIHGWVEGLDLTTDERRDVGQLRNGRDVDAVCGEVLARAVRREHFDVERLQLAGEFRDAIAVRHRQQGSHPGSPPSRRCVTRAPGRRAGLRGRPMRASGRPWARSIPCAMAYSGCAGRSRAPRSIGAPTARATLAATRRDRGRP